MAEKAYVQQPLGQPYHVLLSAIGALARINFAIAEKKRVNPVGVSRSAFIIPVKAWSPQAAKSTSECSQV